MELQLEIQKNDLGKALDWQFSECEMAMIKLLKAAVETQDYAYILKKRLLKRLWGVLILEIQNAEAFHKKFPDSFKTWEKFQGLTDSHFETMKLIF